MTPSNDWKRQRPVRRSRLFFVLPLAVLLGALAVLIWEVFRANLSFADTQQGLYSLRLLGIGPATALFGGGAALILARSQFALAARPQLAGASDLSEDGSRWTVWLYNVGAGHCVVMSLTWQIIARGAVAESHDYRRIYEFIDSAGLSGSLRLRNISPGAPLPCVKIPSDGIELVVLDTNVIGDIGKLSLHIRFRDTVGDEFEWSRDFAEVLPSPVDISHLGSPTRPSQR